MADKKHATTVPAKGQVVEEPLDPLDRLALAPAPGIRRVDVVEALGVMLGDWVLRLSSVIALAKPPVEQNYDI